jgi:hypothetical protein
MKRKLKSGHAWLKTKLGLPDLEHAKIAVIVSLRSFESQRSYRHSIDEFVAGIAPLRDCRSTRRSFSVTDFISKIATLPQEP